MTDEQEDAAIARALNMEGALGEPDELDDEYRAVLSHLSFDEVAPAPGLENQMVAAALARRPAAVPALDTARAKQRSRTRMAILGVTAVAAAIVVAFLLAGGSSPTKAPQGHIELSTSQAADVAAIVAEPGVRVAPFTNNAGKVALSPAGQGDVYDLTVTGPVTIRLESADGSSSLPATAPVDGVIGFGVDHPDRVVAVTLLQNDRELGRATLP